MASDKKTILDLESPGSSPGKKAPFSRNTAVHLFMAAPVFLFYHLGLLVSPKAANGVDIVTRSMGRLAGLSWPVYLAVFLGLIIIYALVWRSFSRKHSFNPKQLTFLLMESGLYALLMGPVAGLLLSKLHVLGPSLDKMGPIDRIVASAGAGFYEELIFRLVALGGFLKLAKNYKMKKWLAVFLGVTITSLIFSSVHYIGAGSDPFDMGSFVYRAVLGCFLSGIFLLRGFATAVWSHALYDVYVMVILMG